MCPADLLLPSNGPEHTRNARAEQLDVLPGSDQVSMQRKTGVQCHPDARRPVGAWTVFPTENGGLL